MNYLNLYNARVNIKPVLWVIFSLLGLFFVSSVSAGGGLVSINVTSYNGISTDLKPGLSYIVRPTAYADNSYKKFCVGCPIKIKFENPQSSDIVNASSDKTDENGTMYAKVISYVSGPRTVYAEVVMPDGTIYTSSKAVLSYLGESNKPSDSTEKPTPVLKLVNPKWYLNLDKGGRNFGRAVELKLENYSARAEDWQTWIKSGGDWQVHNVSLSGSAYIIWIDPYKDYDIKTQVCQNGNVAYAGVNCGEFSNIVHITKVENTSSVAKPSIKSDESLQPVVVPPSIIDQPTVDPEADQLNQKVSDLEKKLEESQKKQSALESRLNQILSWIKSIFPFFK